MKMASQTRSSGLYEFNMSFSLYNLGSRFCQLEEMCLGGEYSATLPAVS